MVGGLPLLSAETALRAVVGGLQLLSAENSFARSVWRPATAEC